MKTRKLKASLLGAVILGLGGYFSFWTFQKNRGLFDFDRICVTKDSTTCSYHWNYRLIDGKWVDTFAQGKTISGFVQTAFAKPYQWSFVVRRSTDDFGVTEEIHSLNAFKTKGHSNSLGVFETELKKVGMDWNLVISLPDRGEKMELTGRWIYQESKLQ